MRVEFLQLDECPNALPMLEALRSAVRQLPYPMDVNVLDIDALARKGDQRAAFGSPTILVDGQDLFPADIPAQASPSCRLYHPSLPSRDEIRQRLLKYMHQQQDLKDRHRTSGGNMGHKEHWEKVFGSKASAEVSWYRPHLDVSLQLIDRSGVDPREAVIDVGGGDSSLVDDLLQRGFSDITVLDIASGALARVRERLGAQATRVTWVESDLLTAPLLEHRYGLWHDRAVFHFLVDKNARQEYITQVLRALKLGGHLILAAFADDGPNRCSGLPTMRYSPEALAREFGEQFQLLESRRERHVTPAGKEQRFVYCLFGRIGS